LLLKGIIYHAHSLINFCKFSSTFEAKFEHSDTFVREIEKKKMLQEAVDEKI